MSTWGDFTWGAGLWGLITDRTQEDYLEWLTLSRIPWGDMTDEQKAMWSVPLKGAYNYTDLNRVGTAILHLRNLFVSYGYSLSVNVRTNWAAGEWPTQTEMNAYIQSLKNIRAALNVLSITPAAPNSMDNGTVTTWNNIEKILVDVEASLEWMQQSFWYCGEIYAGEG